MSTLLGICMYKGMSCSVIVCQSRWCAGRPCRMQINHQKGDAEEENEEDPSSFWCTAWKAAWRKTWRRKPSWAGHCFFPLPWPRPLPAIRRMRSMPQTKKNDDLNIIMPRWTGDAASRLELKTDESDVCHRPAEWRHEKANKTAGDRYPVVLRAHKSWGKRSSNAGKHSEILNRRQWNVTQMPKRC